MKLFSKSKLSFLTFLFLLMPPLFAVDYINNPAYIASNGFGETEQIAQQNVLAGISKFFQMSISVNELAFAPEESLTNMYLKST